MTEEDPIRRKNRWLAFYNEEGGLRDMLGSMKAARFLAIGECEPWETDKLGALAQAGRLVDELDTAIQSIIADGLTAESMKKHNDRIRAIPEHKRKYVNGA